MVQGLFEFESATTDVFLAGRDFDEVCRSHFIARLLRHLAIDAHRSGHDGTLRFLPAFTKAPFYQFRVYPFHGLPAERPPSGCIIDSGERGRTNEQTGTLPTE